MHTAQQHCARQPNTCCRSPDMIRHDTACWPKTPSALHRASLSSPTFPHDRLACCAALCCSNCCCCRNEAGVFTAGGTFTTGTPFKGTLNARNQMTVTVEGSKCECADIPAA